MAPLGSSPAPSLHARVPFHPPRREQDDTPLSVEGELPSWLHGDLVRTCPALFEKGPWRARHLFDGLGMLYAFTVADGTVRYRNRMLRGQQWARIEAGRGWHASWADGPQRSWLRRIVQPLPPSTDNANVNVCRVGDDYVAMTETPHQLRFDPRTLQTLGPKRYEDELGPGVGMIAHPHLDRRDRSLVSVATEMGARSSLILYRVGPDGRRREVVARREFTELPYVHDFGLTQDHALLILHPWRVRPPSMLWSQRGIVDHFHWDAERPTAIAVIDRRNGSWREVEVPGDPFFVFHVANAFARPDGELVLDLLAYPDPGVVEALRIDALLAHFSPAAQLERVRIAADGTSCTRERLVDSPFEFPTIDYRRRSGRPYRYCWGAQDEGGERWLGEVLKVDTHHGEVTRYQRPGWNLGEPLFVPRDRSDERDDAEDDGVLLTVASDLVNDRAELVVLDARTLEPRATAAVDDAIPIGFHGQFFSR
ncbi:MAG: carotenoid oxygenase family protein [Myxococcales bacterium]|nr:carotenoid oxygenase family protein [Myxococcales bacterium]MCB9715103.1 carotenoid oxygenase family protein [Myxococcales bacterium]